MKNIILVISLFFIISASAQAQDIFGRSKITKSDLNIDTLNYGVAVLRVINPDTVAATIGLDASKYTVFRMSLHEDRTFTFIGLPELRWILMVVDDVAFGSGFQPTFSGVTFAYDNEPLGYGVTGFYSFIKIGGVTYGFSKQGL